MFEHDTYREIAKACMELWGQLKFREAYMTYYAEDAVKVEPLAWGDLPNTTVGNEALADHEEWLWETQVIVNSIKAVEGPFIGCNGFSVIIESDFIMRDTQERQVFREVGTYTIENGKIVREEFQYEERELDEALALFAAEEEN